MTLLTIHRLGAEVPADLDQAAPARVERLLRLIADRALEDRNTAYETLSGEWFVRRLDLDLDLAADEPDVSAAARWAGQIAGAIHDLVPDGSNVLHFHNRSRLLLDLVVGVVAGDFARAWAWRRSGLLASTDPDPAEAPGPALVAALGREPDLAVPVLAEAVQQLGGAALHAVLGPAGWSALADVVRPGWRQGMTSCGGPVPGAAPSGHALSGSSPGPGLEQRAAAVLAGSVLAHVIHPAIPAADQTTSDALAVLVLAEADPAGDAQLLPWIKSGLAGQSGPRPTRTVEGGEAPPTARDASALLIRTSRVTRQPSVPPDPPAVQVPPRSDLLSLSPSLAPLHAPAVDEPESVEQPTGPVRITVDPPLADRTVGELRRRDSRASRGAEPTAAAPAVDVAMPALPVAIVADRQLPDQQSATTDSARDHGAPTHWAGLLFLLNTASAAGFPEALLADSRLSGRPLRWVLNALAQRLVPIRADDPAALAFAGLTPTMTVPPGPPVEPAEAQAIDQHATQWAAAVAALLEQARHPQDDTRPPTLWSLARRPGRILADPGWLEVQLELDGIDVSIRRAGLDLDPGWLGWLGVVVVFRYV
jgi:hypothetical protein